MNQDKICGYVWITPGKDNAIHICGIEIPPVDDEHDEPHSCSLPRCDETENK